MIGVKLQECLSRTPFGRAASARQMGISKTTLSLLVNHGIWPKKDPASLRLKIESFLESQGVDPVAIKAAFTEVIDGVAQSDMDDEHSKTLEALRMIRKQSLSPQARRHFGIHREIFSDNMDSLDDVFLSPEINFILESLFVTARHGGMTALYGESGGGKSIIRRALITKLMKEDKDVIVIQPYVLGSSDDTKSKASLRSLHLCEAILAAVASPVKQATSLEVKFRQMHKALRHSSDANKRHVVILEEGHDLSYTFFKNLKRFYELENGLSKLLSFIIIGQPELKNKLSESNPEIRELVQRMELIELKPLDDLPGYVKFRCERAGVQFDKLFAPDALDALAERLSGPASRNGIRKSLLYPLLVGNTLTKTINLAAELGMEKVDAEAVRAA